MIKSDQSQNPDNAPAKNSPRRSSGWGRLFLGGLLAVAALFIFLPNLTGTVCQSPQALAWMTGQPAGRLAIGRASFSWQNPVLLQDVVIKNKAGQALAQVDSLTAKKSFWDILTKPAGPLRLHLEGLRMTVVVKDSGAMEQKTDVPALSRALGSSLTTSLVPRPVLALDLTIDNSFIEFRNERDELLDLWSGLSAEYHSVLEPSPLQTFQVRLPANPERNTGELLLTGDIKTTPGPTPTDTVSIELHSDRTSLIPAQPFLRKYLGPNQPLQQGSGTLTATFMEHPTQGWKTSAVLKAVDPNQQGSTVQLNLEGGYSRPDDLLTLNDVQLTAQGAAVKLRGKVSQISTIQLLELQGEISTAGSPLLDLLPDSLQREIQIQGMSVGQIQLAGPLRPVPDVPSPGLAASMVVGWNFAHAYGLTSNNGKLRLVFQNQQLKSEIIDVPVNGGHLRQLPMIDLSGPRPVASFKEGVVLENVELTEDICRGWMMYTNPTLANATSSEGRFSLAMHPGQFIIGAPELSEISGVLAIRDGKVKPGPLAIAVLGNVAQLEAITQKLKVPDLAQQTIMEIADEQLAFLLKEGRVYHDKFTVNVRGMQVSTSGSVGLDQTLSLKVVMPIPDKWVAGGGPVLMALKGEVLQLVVLGTINKPDVDGRPVADFAKRFGVNAVGGLLDRLIERRQQRGR